MKRNGANRKFNRSSQGKDNLKPLLALNKHSKLGECQNACENEIFSKKAARKHESPYGVLV